MASKESLTGRMLAEPLRHPMPDVRNQAMRQIQDKEQLHVEGADFNNLRSVNVSVPLRQMVAVTGVSGSGKSTLVRGIIYANVKHALAHKRKKSVAWKGADNINGWQGIDRILEVRSEEHTSELQSRG